MTDPRINVRVVYPASPGSQSLEQSAIIPASHTQLQFVYTSRPCSTEWNHLAGSLEERLQELLDAIQDDNCQAIICGRGGYGCSDILPHIPWNQLLGTPPKPLIGFSDISALHAAFLAMLKWQGIHGPMPDTSYWQTSDGSDIRNLETGIMTGKWLHELELYYQTFLQPLEGWLFGGCLSVLSNLIGTPYLPQDLSGSILFFEDVGESPGRLLRHFNQWVHAGLTRNVAGILLGQFSACGLDSDADYIHLANELALRSQKPVALTKAFGHCHTNQPLPIGHHAILVDGRLKLKKGLTHVT